MFDGFKGLRRINEHQERIEKLERNLHALELEWENTYDKVRHMMGRIAKRAALVQNADTDQSTLGETVTSVPALTSPHFSGLTERQRAAQMQILARRKQGGQ